MNHETQSKIESRNEQHYLEDIKKELFTIKDVAILKNDVKPMLKWFDGMNVSRKLDVDFGIICVNRGFNF